MKEYGEGGVMWRIHFAIWLSFGWIDLRGLACEELLSEHHSMLLSVRFESMNIKSRKVSWNAIWVLYPSFTPSSADHAIPNVNRLWACLIWISNLLDSLEANLSQNDWGYASSPVNFFSIGMWVLRLVFLGWEAGESWMGRCVNVLHRFIWKVLGVKNAIFIIFYCGLDERGF